MHVCIGLCPRGVHIKKMLDYYYAHTHNQAMGTRISAAVRVGLRSRSQADLARSLGCDQGLVSRWAAGRVLPGPGYLGPLARELGVRLDELVELCASDRRSRRRRAA